MREGKLVIEHYQGDAQPDTYVGIASVTKSITAILVGIALDKGVLKSVDQPITDFFPELNEPMSIQNRARSRSRICSRSRQDGR